MNILVPFLALALLALQTAAAECKSAYLYSDGAVIELDATAHKGSIEVHLPAGVIDDSLRVRPVGDTAVLHVELLPAATDAGKGAKELNALLEQRERLGDRMQALSTREEVFRSAAKSQSGKAPRRTKTNPEPLQSIRQGTDFAIAQLESVYTARRKTEQEIKRLDNRIAALKKSSSGTAMLARIQLAPARGRVVIRYAVSGQGWRPRYDFHLGDGDSARVHLYGLFSGAFSGYLLQASPAGLAEHGTVRMFPVAAGPSPRLASYSLPLSEVRFGGGIRSSFSFVARNTGAEHLPAGDASLYRNGEYVGRFRFEGISSGRARRIATGM